MLYVLAEGYVSFRAYNRVQQSPKERQNRCCYYVKLCIQAHSNNVADDLTEN